MTPEKLDRDSLSRLYSLAQKAQELAYNSQNPQAVEDFNDAASPDAITALIDRVRELEGVLDSIRIYGSDTLSGPSEPTPDRSRWHAEGVIEMTKRARAALERSEILNKE